MDYNTLYAIVQFIYTGRVQLKTELEDEDFRSAMRTLNIRLGDEVNARVFEDAPPPPTSKVLKKAPLHTKVSFNDAEEYPRL